MVLTGLASLGETAGPQEPAVVTRTAASSVLRQDNQADLKESRRGRARERPQGDVQASSKGLCSVGEGERGSPPGASPTPNPGCRCVPGACCSATGQLWVRWSWRLRSGWLRPEFPLLPSCFGESALIQEKVTYLGGWGRVSRGGGEARGGVESVQRSGNGLFSLPRTQGPPSALPSHVGCPDPALKTPQNTSPPIRIPFSPWSLADETSKTTC